VWKICTCLSDLKLSQRRTFNLPSRGMRNLSVQPVSSSTMNMQTITVVPLYLTTMRCVQEDYNIKMHANSEHVTPLIIVIKIIFLTAKVRCDIFWCHFCYVQAFVFFSLLVADLHNICGYCKCVFKNKPFMLIVQTAVFFYFLSFSTFLSPYFPVVLPSLPSWCDFSSSSAELFLPQHWYSSFLFYLTGMFLSQTEQYGTKLWERTIINIEAALWAGMLLSLFFISELYIFNLPSVTLC